MNQPGECSTRKGHLAESQHVEGGQPVFVKWIAEIKAQFHEIRVPFTGHSYVFFPVIEGEK